VFDPIAGKQLKDAVLGTHDKFPTNSCNKRRRCHVRMSLCTSVSLTVAA